MPSTYAHYFFGKKARPLLPERVSRAVDENRQLYDIGLHGPDILFYYRPLRDHPVNHLGYAMHSQPGKEFFFPARDILAAAGDQEAALAYLAGFLCHYTLDSTCHGYVEKKLSVSSLFHADIENEFDRYLLQKEGKDIFHTDITAHIVPSARNSAVIADFFPDVAEVQIQTALKSMKLYCGMLCGGSCRRHLAKIVLKAGRCSEDMQHAVVENKQLPESTDSNLRLEKLMEKALKDCADRICRYDAFLRGGPNLTDMEATFGPEAGWEKIPVLSADEEKNYEIKVNAD